MAAQQWWIGSNHRASNLEGTFCRRRSPAARREHPQPMAIEVERDEGAAKIHGGWRLNDLHPAFAPFVAARIDGFIALDGERDFAAARDVGRGLDTIKPPEPEYDPRLHRKHDECRRGLDGRAS